MRDLNMIERQTVSGGALFIGGGINGNTGSGSGTGVGINFGKPGHSSNGGKGGDGFGVVIKGSNGKLPGNGSSWLSKFFK